MKSDYQDRISKERELTFSNVSPITIENACVVGNGIAQIPTELWKNFESDFSKRHINITFFIPASGNGSRMFEFFYNYLQDKSSENITQLELFFKNLNSFAFYHAISEEWKEKLLGQNVDWIAFLTYLMEAEGLNYASLPKAIFPFHRYNDENTSPIQEHVYQGGLLKNKKVNFHFTTQPEYLKNFKEKFRRNEEKETFEIDFSFQNNDSDSFVFDADKNVLVDRDGNFVRRPSGHGALLENLNSIDAQLLFIKNIDNVQCRNFMKHSNEIWSGLTGLLFHIKSTLKKIILNKDKDALKKMNDQYCIFHQSQFNENTSWMEIERLCNRPIRVCGMVPNEGQPGGGPFWVTHNGITSKQIVEKSQLTSSENLSHLLQSTHFNPVIIVADKSNLKDEKIELSRFSNNDFGIVVSKNHLGKPIKYLEKPGLWNGGMYHWTSLFVEIPGTVFSPVKTVMDLLETRHLCI